MSISTKKGDDGTSCLWSGERVFKDSLRMEAYGTVDELDSVIADAKHYIKNTESVKILENVQKKLFYVNAELATSAGKYNSALSKQDEEEISSIVYKIEEEVGLKGLVIPGATKSSAKLDIARTVCRRAERRIVSLSHEEKISSIILEYINRLSDLLFILARLEEKNDGGIKYVK